MMHSGLLYEAKDVAATIDYMNVEDEVTYDITAFLSEELYDTVCEGLQMAGLRKTLGAGVLRWYEGNGKTFYCDFRNDVIIIRRKR